MSNTDIEELNSLTARIHSLPASDTENMLMLYQRYVCGLLGATNSYWVAAYRGKFGRETWRTKMMEDWKIVDAVYSGNPNPSTDEVSKEYFVKAFETGMDPQAAHAIRNAGKTRVHRLKDTIALEDWEKHWMHERLLSENVGERLVGAYCLGPKAESYLLVDRNPGEPEFTEEDAQILLDALLKFPRVHYWLMLERGLVPPAKKSFSPRQREVLKHLMGPKPEKQIADELGLSKGALHNYVIDIYKNLGVGSRYEVMQCWLAAIPES
ncbi:MAG: hypothetical protein COA96_17365 [SAR86 cluster bacterium]|uniref:HTH luxR-type domain-containing protein n=1 Tax=SAR86 cluster bacterium TaxID=2030880 RepID=A0A2A5AF90_9GAMM|nr:MAG: hypothetical protein COA96_17365 [SAR86 cluster bacterium]